MAAKRPAAPHLSVSAYPVAGAQDELFRVACEVAGGDNAPPVTVEVLPAGLRFEAISDVADELRTVEPGSGSGPSGGWRPVRARLSNAASGDVEVAFERAYGSDRHAVTALTHAGALGFPAGIWTGRQRKEAAELAEWARSSLRAVCERSDVLYGEIGVESTLPGPSTLLSDGWELGSTAYLSTSLLAAGSSFLGKLRARYGKDVVEEWPTGFYVCGWAPLSTTGHGVDDPRGLMKSVTGYLGERLRYIS